VAVKGTRFVGCPSKSVKATQFSAIADSELIGHCDRIIGQLIVDLTK